MTTAVQPSERGREDFSERLLKGSVKKSYAPVVDIDWDAPLDPDKFYLPPKTVSIYGTPMWDEMTRAQRIELSRQELVNTLSAGIWFENILNQALLRKLMHTDPTSRASLRAHRAGRRDPSHGDVRQGHRTGRRQAGTPAALSPDDHQRAAVLFPRLGALGGRADRRGDLRLVAAPDDGRSRTAADHPAADANSRRRRGPPHS